MKEATSIKKKEETLPAELLEDMEGFGVEFSQEEVVYPFISRIQSNSPQILKGDPEYIEGALPGKMMHTTSRKLYDELKFIPLKFQNVTIQWRSRDTGGGFVAAYSPGDPNIPATHKVDNISVLNDDPTQYLEPNLQYISMFFTPDMEPIGPAILSCNKSQLKYARRFNVGLQSKKIDLADGRKIVAPIFSHIYDLSLLQDSNAKGSWYSFRFGEGQPIKDTALLKEMMGQAKAMRELEQVFVPQDEQAEATTTNDSFEI